MKSNFVIDKKDLKLTLLNLFILFPFFVPDYVMRINLIPGSICDYWKIISMLVLLIVCFKKNKTSKPVILLLLFNVFLLFSTLINQGAIINCIKYISGIMTLVLVFDIMSMNIKNLLTILQFYFMIVAISNCISILLYPNGMYITDTTNRNWLLGYDNTHIQYLLPGFVIALLNLKIHNHRIQSALLIFSILISVIICNSTTTIVGISIISLLSFFPFLKKKTSVFNFKNYLITSIIVFFLIVIFRAQNLFAFFIVDILHKDLTFTNRTILWDITLVYFMNKPLLGNGWQSYDFRHYMYGRMSIVFAHNQYLEWLYLGGIVYIAIYFAICKYINKISANIKNNDLVQIIMSGFLVLQVLWITEVYLNPIIYIILILCLYCDKISELSKENLNEIKN